MNTHAIERFLRSLFRPDRVANIRLREMKLERGLTTDDRRATLQFNAIVFDEAPGETAYQHACDFTLDLDSVRINFFEKEFGELELPTPNDEPAPDFQEHLKNL